MPIYEYRCSECGFQEEYLQKVSEPPMTVCPSCGKATFQKLLTAAGFQLKGSGWYATDFRNPARATKSSEPKPAADSAEAKPEAKSESKSDGKDKPKPKSEAPASGGGGASG
jgi:putative FmdB family regulatory protein